MRKSGRLPLLVVATFLLKSGTSSFFLNHSLHARVRRFISLLFLFRQLLATYYTSDGVFGCQLRLFVSLFVS